jgi:hypothetical protein
MAVAKKAHATTWTSCLHCLRDETRVAVTRNRPKVFAHESNTSAALALRQTLPGIAKTSHMENPAKAIPTGDLNATRPFKLSAAIKTQQIERTNGTWIDTKKKSVTRLRLQKSRRERANQPIRWTGLTSPAEENV